MPGMPGKDTKTRYQGVFARHQQHCPIGEGSRCTCKPSYYGVCYDRARKKRVKTKRMSTAEAARNARADVARMLEQGETPITNALRLSDARERFVSGCARGAGLEQAWASLQAASHRQHRGEPPAPRRAEPWAARGCPISVVATFRRSSTISPRRCREAVCARSLMRSDRSTGGRRIVTWPAMIRPRSSACRRWTLRRSNGSPRLANSHTCWPRCHSRRRCRTHSLVTAWVAARRSCISGGRRSIWKVGAIEWGVEWEARKYEASRRVVPTVPPLLAMLKRAYLEQGRPDGKRKVCPPPGITRTARDYSTHRRSECAPARRGRRGGLTPITLQESRHTAATWLDAAGVPPKIASVLMGHATPARQPGAAQITLARYTHTLPEDIEDARTKLRRISRSIRKRGQTADDSSFPFPVPPKP